MKYLIELNFNSGVHFGSDVAGFGKEDVQGFAHSDTLFSALINTLAQVRSEFSHLSWVENIFEEPRNGKAVTVPFKLSSFGFTDTSEADHRYYIPKPLSSLVNILDKPPKHENIKEFKRRKFVSIETYRSWQQNQPFNLEKILENDRASFWTEESKIQHLSDNMTLATQIYRTGLVFYDEYVKPFFLVDLAEDEFSINDFLKLLNVLKFNGLGGIRTSGCGIFDFDEDGWFCIDLENLQEQNTSFNHQKTTAHSVFREIFNHQSNDHYLFSTYFPQNSENIEAAAYELIQRKGWFFSTTSFQQLKRRTCFMFSEGSIFRAELAGKIVDVTPGEFTEHRIYRNGVPFTIPFSGGPE